MYVITFHILGVRCYSLCLKWPCWSCPAHVHHEITVKQLNDPDGNTNISAFHIFGLNICFDPWIHSADEIRASQNGYGWNIKSGGNIYNRVYEIEKMLLKTKPWVKLYCEISPWKWTKKIFWKFWCFTCQICIFKFKHLLIKVKNQLRDTLKCVK